MNTLEKRPGLRLKNRGGAPKGNRNAWKTGATCRENRALFRKIAAFKRQVCATLKAVGAEIAQHKE